MWEMLKNFRRWAKQGMIYYFPCLKGTASSVPGFCLCNCKSPWDRHPLWKLLAWAVNLATFKFLKPGSCNGWCWVTLTVGCSTSAVMHRHLPCTDAFKKTLFHKRSAWGWHGAPPAAMEAQLLHHQWLPALRPWSVATGDGQEGGTDHPVV